VEFRSALMKEQERIRQDYQNRLKNLEQERSHVENDKAEVDRYKQLLVKQRDIMIQLTARLNERDQSILALQDELDAYDRQTRKMEEMLDQDSDELKLHLEVLDTQAIHSLSAAPSGIVTWQLENIRHLRQQMDEGERLSSRYINEPPRVKGEKGNFLSLGIAFLGGGLEFAITRVERPPPGYSSNEDDVFSVSLTADDKDLETKEVRCSWTGVSDTKTVRFEIPKGKLPESISFKLARV